MRPLELSYEEDPQLLLFRPRLRDRMEELGMTMGELAAASGQSQSCVRMWLTGVRLPTAPSLIRVSRALGVPTDWLLGETPSECGRRAIEAYSAAAARRSRRTPAPEAPAAPRAAENPPQGEDPEGRGGHADEEPGTVLQDRR